MCQAAAVSSARDVRPYGTWPSPVTPELVVQAAVSLGEVWVEDQAVDDSPVWWSELRPQEGGRVQIVRAAPGEAPRDVLPEGFGARTRVHEYGGGAWWLHAGTLFFANWDDQRLHRLGPQDPVPVPITRPPAFPHGLRYADGRVTPDGNWVICVRESHEGEGECCNELVALPVSGGEARGLGTGADFVSNPRPSPDGRWLAWVQWSHPHMPWDASELWVAALMADRDDVELVDPRRVAGGSDEAVTQPEWSPRGVLHFLSDRAGWSNLYRCSGPGRPEPGDEGTVVVAMPSDVGTPPWVFGTSRYAFVGDEPCRVAMAVTREGVDGLRVLEEAGAGWVEWAVGERGATSFTCLKRRGAGLTAVVAGFDQEPAVVSIDPSGDGTGGHDDRGWVVLRPPRDLGLDRSWWSVPRHVTFPTGPPGSEGRSGAVAHGLYYPPTNPDCSGPAGERPPLLVAIHGGPTSAARPQLQLGLQFWTSRGFGVVDVNYRGSTGYGRDFRRLLEGRWGVSDVEDCGAAASWLAAQGLVDGDRLAIHGGSAGGFTTLMALITTGRFAAGTSSYGVTDLEALAQDTHKFESRYLDGLVGPYPEQRVRYRERSPLHHLDRLDAPVLVLQGLEDEVVPPSQAESLVAALDRNGVPHAYFAFEGEQHGFRQATTIKRALEAELFFYACILGFEEPAGIEPIFIEHLPER